MNPFDLLNIPLGALMKFLYGLFNNYALAIFFFALAVKIVLLPLGIQQQKSQIKMAKIRPKEQAIRGKYAGRTDTATQQKMQAEIMDMYKKENYSPMSGCLPLLVQLPILFALYNIIRNPLTYIATLSAETIDNVKKVIFDNIDLYAESIRGLGAVSKFENIQQIDIVKIFINSEWFENIKSQVIELADFQRLDFGFFGQQLTNSPSEALAAGLNILLLIPVLNFAASFLQMRLQKVINANTMAGDAANNKGMKFMEYGMPLLIVYMAYSMYAALGLYWVFQSLLGIGQMLVLAKIYPLPKISDEEYELARQEYGAAKKKKKKKPVVETEDDEVDEIEEANNDDGNGPANSPQGETNGVKGLKPAEIKDEKYISKTIPKGINQNAKNNYQKTGKKYTIKKRKK